MTLNFFDSDQQCGYDRNYDSAGDNPNIIFTPNTVLTWNSENIKELADRVDKLDVHTFGNQNIKYRYWRIGNFRIRTGGNSKGCIDYSFAESQANLIIDRFNFYHEGKQFWNGYYVETNDCVSNKINDQIENISIVSGNAIIDFGPNKQYAITSITQTSDPNYAFVNYTGYETMEAFSVEASDDGVNWTFLCRFEEIPDPTEPIDSSNPQSELQFGAETPHCIIQVPPQFSEVYPVDTPNLSDLSPNDGTAYKWIIDQMQFATEDTFFQTGNNAGSGVVLNATQGLAIQLFADGKLYESGQQHIPGTNVTSLVTNAQSNSGRNNDYFEDDDFISLVGSTAGGLEGTEFGFIFDRFKPQNITSVRFATTSPTQVLSFRIRGINQCNDVVTEVIFDSDFVATELVNLGNRTSGSSVEGWSDHYIVMRTAKDEGAVFPGDAARMWPAPEVETGGGGGGEALTHIDLGNLSMISFGTNNIDISGANYFTAEFTGASSFTAAFTGADSTPGAVTRFHMLMTINTEGSFVFQDVIWVNSNVPGLFTPYAVEFFTVDNGSTWYGINYGDATTG